MQFVLFHGTFATPTENWFPWLKKELEAFGQSVLVPRFPTPENQNLTNWLSVFDHARRNFTKDEPLCFIGHSMGPLFILHAVTHFTIQLDSAIFVSPFLTKVGHSTFDPLNVTFYRGGFNFTLLRKLIPTSTVIYSDNDPYVAQALSITFAEKLGSKKLLMNGGGHFNIDSGFSSFPQVLELCEERLVGH